MSRFIIAFLCFLAINLLATKVLLQASLDDYTKQSQSEERTWTEWALADFAKQKGKPLPIVILGSSLVLTPVSLADANFFNGTISGALHHRSDLLDKFLAASGERMSSNFSFALPGLMPSDAYLIARLMLDHNNHKLIVYGVGPRDFVDNLLASPASTDPYRCLSKSLYELGDRQASLSFIGKGWQSHLDFILANHFPVYGHKEEILAILLRQWQGLMHPVVNSIASLAIIPVLPNQLTVADVHNILPNYNPMSIGIKQCLFFPHPQIDPDRFSKDLNEYRQRYQKVNWDTFACQTEFFKNLLKLARVNDFNVLVVAMPITSVNRELLPDYVLTAYRQNLRVLTKTYGASFIDLDNGGRFNDEDFGDTVHLSTTGSIKFIRIVADYVRQHKLLQSRNSQRRIQDRIQERNVDHTHLANTGVKI